MKNKWISLKAIKSHELSTTARKLDVESNSWHSKFEGFYDLEKRAIRQITVLSSQLIGAYLIMSSLRDGNLLAVNLGKIQASVPAAFFMAVSSLILLFFSIQFNHLSAVMSARIKHGTKMLNPGFNVEVLAMMLNKNDNALGIPILINPFFKEIIPVSGFLTIGTLLALFSALLPIFGFGWYIANQQLGLLLDSDVAFIERVASLSGFALVIFSFINLIFFHLPLPMRKNTFSIRWGLLYRLSGGRHPRSNAWLDDKDRRNNKP